MSLVKYWSYKTTKAKKTKLSSCKSTLHKNLYQKHLQKPLWIIWHHGGLPQMFCFDIRPWKVPRINSTHSMCGPDTSQHLHCLRPPWSMAFEDATSPPSTLKSRYLYLLAAYPQNYPINRKTIENNQPLDTMGTAGPTPDDHYWY